MITEKQIKNIIDDHERRITLLEGKKLSKSEKINGRKPKIENKKGGTTDKILSLNNDGFFNQPKTINQILDKLKDKDYHFKASDITLPLRRIVRNGVLKRTKLLRDGTKSKNWVYLREEHENK